MFPGGTGKALGDGGKLENMKWRLAKSNKNGLSQADMVEYKNMIKKALRSISKTTRSASGTYKQICDEMKRLFPKKLNGRRDSNDNASPWKRIVRQLLFSDFDFARDKRTTSSRTFIFKCKR